MVNCSIPEIKRSVVKLSSTKGRTIRKLMEGAGEVQKKKFAQGKIKWKKILARQLTLRNTHARAWKNSYKEFESEKKFLQLENSPPPPPP